jgi:hypothetical protein
MKDYCIHADESGQREFGISPVDHFVVAGVACAADETSNLEAELRGLKRGFFKSTSVEIKSTWLRIPATAKARYLDPYGISQTKLDGFVEALYAWIEDAPITLFAAVIDKNQLRERYTTPHHPSAVGYCMLLQRYQMYLDGVRGRGSVLFDEISGKSEAGNAWMKLLRRQHRMLKDYGCPYTDLRFPNVTAEIAFADSRASSLIQIADIVAYNTLRQFRAYGSTWDDPTAKSLDLYPYFSRILPKFDQSPSRVFSGYGVAKMPKLASHHWLVPA